MLKKGRYVQDYGMRKLVQLRLAQKLWLSSTLSNLGSLGLLLTFYQLHCYSFIEILELENISSNLSQLRCHLGAAQDSLANACVARYRC